MVLMFIVKTDTCQLHPTDDSFLPTNSFFYPQFMDLVVYYEIEISLNTEHNRKGGGVCLAFMSITDIDN